jgi:hypothetical protein
MEDVDASSIVEEDNASFSWCLVGGPLHNKQTKSMKPDRIMNR